MKRFLSITFIAIAASLTAYIYAGKPIDASQLPKNAQTFISKYFPGDKVRKAETDYGRRGLEYEVDLISGAEIDFTEDGQWKKVDAARGNTVPAAIVPKAIATYVSKNFPGQGIKEISRKRGGYKVELTGGSELMLTADGKPL